MALELLLQEAQGLSEEALMQVVRFIKFIKAEGIVDASAHGDQEPDVRTRKAGAYKGQIWIADDLDAPLPEFKEYM